MSEQMITENDSLGLVDGYVVLKIDNTSNAAFVDVGRDFEISRIISTAAERISTAVDLNDLHFPLRDLNGNRVGQVEFTKNVQNVTQDDGTLRAVINVSNDAFKADFASELKDIFLTAAVKIRDNEHAFSLTDTNGNEVGKVHFQEFKSLERNGMLDMLTALNENKIYLAEEGRGELADGDYRFVITTLDFEPGYGQGEGEAWLVNAKGEKALGFETPQLVRETSFRKLSNEERELLRSVVIGTVEFEDFERRFTGDTPELN